MYFTTERLLRYTALEGLLILINQSTGLQLTPGATDVISLESIGEVRTRVRLRATEPDNPMALQFHSGERDFEYNRIRLSDVFEDGQRVYIDIPTTSHDVIDAIRTASGVVIDHSDVTLVPITTEQYVLTARHDSLRWVGSVTLQLGAVPHCTLLTESLLGSVLTDFVYPDQANRLANSLVIQLLDDFVYPVCDCIELGEALLVNTLIDFVQPEFICDFNDLADSLTNNVLGELIYPEVLAARLDITVPSGELDGFGEHPIPLLDTVVPPGELDGFSNALSLQTSIPSQLEGFEPR